MATTGKKSEVTGSCRSYVNIVLPYGYNKDERVKRAKNMGFPPLCSEKSALSSETFAFFETTISFSGACNISVHALAATSSKICTRKRCKNMNG